MIKVGRSLNLALGVMAVLTPFAGAAPIPKPNSKLLAAIMACQPGSRALLEQLVAIDSGTGDGDGLAKVGAIYASKLREVGAIVEMSPPTATAVGDNLVATVTGTGKGRILLIAHMDTVFARGTAAAHPSVGRASD